MSDQEPTLAKLGQTLVSHALLKGDFLLSSGKRSDYYLDKYLFETQPQLLRQITPKLLSLVPKTTEVLAGPELGAVPLVTSMSLSSNLPFIIVRREAKQYGTSRNFEGVVSAGQRVVLVEDVVTSGQQALTSAKRLRDFGVHLDTCICVLDREEGGTESFASLGITLTPLFTSSSLGLT
tara:strand:+ start:297 stop:833 length:537 start_codon:yes stop_codon:yes gene_type:complete